MTQPPLIQSEPLDFGSFSPTRLTVARQSRGLTKKALADRIGVTAPAVTQFEAATNGPDLNTVHSMATALDFPVPFFFGHDLNLMPEDALTFRSRRSMTASLRVKAQAAAVIATDVVSPAIRGRFSLPQPDIPDLPDYGPEEAAERLRHQWRLGYGPVSNMVHLLEARGVETYWHREDVSSLDAFSWWDNDRPFVMLNSAKPGGDRGRFDAAHELAHLVLHRDEKDLDAREVEAQADRFASAFLMPPDQFRKESPRYPILDYFRPLKRRWGTSLAAMVRRSRDVGVFSDWQYECACRDIAVKGWKAKEPWPIEREQSQVHRIVFGRLLEKDITPERFAQSVHLPFPYLETVLPVLSKIHEQYLYGEDPYSLHALRQVDSDQQRGSRPTG